MTGLKPIPQQVQTLIHDAISTAQSSGDLPAFEIPNEIPISPAKSAEHGDYASPIAMGLAKAARRKPLDIVTAIQAHLPESEIIESVEVAPPGFLIVTPGVRPAGGDVGDQKRVMTPSEARRAGADLVVVGRPVRGAADPAAAARAIAAELAAA